MSGPLPKHQKHETPHDTRLPAWTNYHNKQAFALLAEQVRQRFQWNSTELLFLELLARFAKVVSVDVHRFFAAIPEKYLRNIQPNERHARVAAFFEKLAEADLCVIKHRSDESNHPTTVRLKQPDTADQRREKEFLEPARQFIENFYRRRDFKKLIESTRIHLPNPLMIQEYTPLAAGSLVSLHSQRLSSLVFSSKQTPHPAPEFTQEIVNAAEKPFLLIDFPRLTDFDTQKRHQTPPAERPDEQAVEESFQVVLPQTVVLRDLIKSFLVPLVVAYLLSEKNKDVFKTIHYEWTKKLHSSMSEAQLDPEVRIERTLMAADLNDTAYFASVHVLTHVLRHLKLRNLPSAPPPVVYEASRFIYDHAIACRQLLNLEKQRKAEQAADEALIINHLLKEVYVTPPGSSLSGPLPIAKSVIEDLPDCTGSITLGRKYQDVRHLLPLDPSTVDQVPKVLEIQGKFIHRWHLINYFILVQHLESRLVSQRLAGLWGEIGIPRSGGFAVPGDFISEDFIKVVQTVANYRNGVGLNLRDDQIGKEFSVFLQYFFPSSGDAAAAGVKGLLKSTDQDGSGGKGPKAIVREDVDRILYKDTRNYVLKAYKDMLYLEHSTIKRSASIQLRQRLGTFGYYWFLLRGMLGMQNNLAAKKRNGGGTGSGDAARRSGPPVVQLRTPSRPVDPAQLRAINEELGHTLDKIPRILRVRREVFQDSVDPVVALLNPDIRNLNDEGAKQYVKEFISKTPKLNNLPYRADPIFVRYLTLLMRRNNLKQS